MKFTGFSPNTTAKDSRIAWSYIVFPWKWIAWKKGAKNVQAEQALETYFGNNGTSILTFDSGRSALFLALKALEIGPGDEVLVQAFTCVVVINAIKWSGATPVYVDIEADTLNMDPFDAQQKCTSKTRALIIQHTFGLPADVSDLLALAKKNGLKTIEDCAHSLGARSEGKLTGTFADIGMLSFGGEKVISCVRGGALVTSNPAIVTTLRRMQSELPDMTMRQIVQHLLHVILFPIGKRTYAFGGKALLHAAKKLRITNKIIESNEKKGKQVLPYPTHLPNALAALLLHQIPQIDARNTHRQQLAAAYQTALQKKAGQLLAHTNEHIYLRFPFLAQNQKATLENAKKNGVLLGNWYNTVIGPKDTDMSKTGYKNNSCPRAEDVTKHIINFPTNIHISLSDIEDVIKATFE